MPSIQQELREIKQRNQRVELDKAWETSWTRRIAIGVLTYIVVVLFFVAAGFPKPFVSALVPTIGFLLSTLTLAGFKRLWVRAR